MLSASLLAALACASVPIGETASAMPGILRVGTANPAPTGFSAAASAGYGFTEGVLEQGDQHHRAAGTLAVGYRPWEWIAVALRLDGRLDRHTTDAGSDSGMVGDPRLIIRGGTELVDDLSLGGQFVGWFPGNDAPSLDPDAASFDFSLLATYAPSPFVFSVNAGFRLDRSGNAAPDEAVSLSDRLALGLSESNAILLGAGAGVRAGSVELLMDWTWDVLVGSLAPPVAASPMLLSAGARYTATDDGSIQLWAMAQVAPAGRPIVDPRYPLVPVEPLVGFVAGFNYRPGTDADKPVVVDAPPPPPPLKPAPPPPPPVPKFGSFNGRVTTTDGSPLAGARVEVETHEENHVTLVGAGGAFSLSKVAVGPAKVRISAEGYATLDLTVSIRPGQPTELELSLKPELPSGQLKGQVRGLDGRPVGASVLIEPLGVELNVDPQGAFEISLPPGAYWVTVSLDGYRQQRKRVRVARDEVVVLNVELKKRR